MPPENPSPRRTPRFALWALAVLIAGLGLWKSVESYRVRRLENFLRAGRLALEQRDYRTAEAWVLRVLQTEPANASAIRLGAKIEDALDLPDAAVWWARVVQLDHGQPEDLFSWAKAALRNDDRDGASRALQLVPAAARSASYHELMAGQALANRQPEAADIHFKEAARAEPENPAHLVNLASLRLHARDAAAAAAARQELESNYAENPATRLLALRALLGDASRQHDSGRVHALREKMLMIPDRTWNDELLCLEAALGTEDFAGELAAAESSAQAHPQKFVPLAEWLTAHGQAAETRRWLASLPETLQANPRLQISMTNALTVLGEWRPLRAFLAGKNWGQLDYLRRATLVRTTREVGEPYAADWRKLTAELGDRPDGMLLVGQTAQAWGWPEEAEDLFCKATEQGFEIRRAALRSLWIRYGLAGNTPGLWRVARQQYDDAPTELLAKNNYAFLSLLLNTAQTAALRLAEEVGKSEAAPPEFVATYAYALCRDHRPAEALAALQRLPEAALRRPGVALYYALALSGAGDRRKAAEFAALATDGSFLPEEKRLLVRLQTDLADRQSVQESAAQPAGAADPHR